jgi:sulfotransferase family protein
MRIPTFFIAGAPKAGTTSLYEWCKQHPSVFMSPIKEPCFFAPEVVDFTPRARRSFDADAPALRRWLDGPRAERRTSGIVIEWQDYLSLFRDAGDAVALGEASGNYLPSHAAPAAIRSRVPDARIVVMLRHPVDRLFSQYASAVGAGDATGSFGAWADEQARLEAGRQPRFGAVWTGMYGEHLGRWYKAFPESQVRLFFYEDYCERPEAVFAELFAFLGVTGTHKVDMTRRHNVTTVPRWPRLMRGMEPIKPIVRRLMPGPAVSRLRRLTRGRPPFQPTVDERRTVLAMYREDLKTLQTMTRRDLSHWLAVQQ